jgi:hypothetical protein
MRRRTITIIALGTLVVSMLLWGLSIPGITYREPKGMSFVADLRTGVLTVHNGGSYTRPGWQIGPRSRRLNWWPYKGSFAQWYPAPGGYRFTLPLWIPALLSAAALLVVRTIPPRDPHACRSCGYSRYGLVPSIPCPECGAPDHASSYSPRPPVT